MIELVCYKFIIKDVNRLNIRLYKNLTTKIEWAE